MPSAPDPDNIGVNMVAYSLAQKDRLGYKTTPVEPILDQTGAPVMGATYGEDGEWSIDGLGDLPSGLVVGGGSGSDPSMYNVSGGQILCLNLTKGDNIKNWNSWHASGEHLPDAS